MTRALGVFAVALLWLGCTAPLRTLFLPDEGRYVGVAWEMVNSGRWLTPTLDGLPFFHKPPLFYWITAAAMKLFGPTEAAARLASVIAAAATVAAVHEFVRRWQGVRAARWSAAVLATLPMFVIGAQFANLDMLVASCIAVTILLAAHSALQVEAGRDHRRALAAAYATMALGVLAKGLIGLVLPGLVMLIWLAQGRRWHALRAMLWPPGIALCAAIAVPWFVAMQREHAQFLHYFFVVQHFQRFVQSGFNSVEPTWFYVPVLLVFPLPWTAWLARLGFSGGRATVVPHRLASLAWVWLGVVVVFFSVPQSKLLGYILPALVPVALLIVQQALPLVDRSVVARRAWWTCLVIAPLISLGFIAAYALDNPKSSRELAQALAARQRDGEGVAVLDEYSYDLMFYARGVQPLYVVTNWDPAEVAANDNWRKELADAGTFDPQRGRDRLLSVAQFNAAVCAGHISWVVADADTLTHHPVLRASEVAATHATRILWHVDARLAGLRSALGCAAGADAAALVRR